MAARGPQTTSITSQGQRHASRAPTPWVLHIGHDRCFCSRGSTRNRNQRLRALIGLSSPILHDHFIDDPPCGHVTETNQNVCPQELWTTHLFEPHRFAMQVVLSALAGAIERLAHDGSLAGALRVIKRLPLGQQESRSNRTLLVSMGKPLSFPCVTVPQVLRLGRTVNAHVSSAHQISVAGHDNHGEDLHSRSLDGTSVCPPHEQHNQLGPDFAVLGPAAHRAAPCLPLGSGRMMDGNECLIETGLSLG